MRRSVAFDLDMTLVDTRPGIALALKALAEDTGQPIDVAHILANLGPPVATALSPWFQGAALNDAVALFRVHMARVGVNNIEPFRGAGEAVDAARDAGFDVIVVTAKIEPLAIATLGHAGLVVDQVYGDHWEKAKAAPLRSHHALCFVGDHPADMTAAALASVDGFGVTSGASSKDQLAAAGASYVAESLLEFPAWLGARIAKAP